MAFLIEILGWSFGTKEQFLQRMKAWEECDTGVQQNCKCATSGRGGRVDFSISEGSSEIPASASAGGNGEIELCATVAP